MMIRARGSQLKNREMASIIERWEGVRHRVISPYLMGGGCLDETVALTTIDSSVHDEVLARVSERSETFGRSVRLQRHQPFSTLELTEILNTEDIRCFSEPWRLTRSGGFNQRRDCRRIPLAFCCDYWREATRGLVAGLSQTHLFSRNQSLAYGNRCCLDRIDEATSGARRQWGEVPDELTYFFIPLTRSLRHDGIELQLCGLSQWTLFVSVASLGHPLTQDRAQSLLAFLASVTTQKYPDLKITIVPPPPLRPPPHTGRIDRRGDRWALTKESISLFTSEKRERRARRGGRAKSP